MIRVIRLEGKEDCDAIKIRRRSWRVEKNATITMRIFFLYVWQGKIGQADGSISIKLYR